ncbi:Hsp20/alpha crystallin family protein [Haloarchaeobius sp. DYHT-AS-18]|uniref:Hsp20/alpha crystallin family protein n=1 Tax=Haloarchaeobius sp. DYHT-AS-18 TaxID=3446117 RepID=UPI003EB6BD0F
MDMATYNPTDMEYMYDQLNRFYDQMGRTYDVMRANAPWMLGEAGPTGERRGEVPRFFEEWDDRRRDASYPRRGGEEYRRGDDYRGREGYDGEYPGGARGGFSPFGPAPAFRFRPGFGGFDYGRDAPDYRPEGRYDDRYDGRGRGERGEYAGYPVDSGRRYELREVDGEFVCICELPGFERSDIECTYEDGVFYIDAYREASEDAENVWMRRPRRVNERVPLARPVTVDDITASYRRGILEVRMPVAGSEGRAGQSITIRD